MEILSLVFIISTTNLNDSAMKAAAEASAKQLKLDQNIIKYLEKNISNEYKPTIKMLCGVNDVVINKRLTLGWSF